MTEHYHLEQILLEQIQEKLQPSLAAVTDGKGNVLVQESATETELKVQEELLHGVLANLSHEAGRTQKGSALAFAITDTTRKVARILYIEVEDPRRLKKRDLATLEDLGQQFRKRYWGEDADRREDDEAAGDLNKAIKAARFTLETLVNLLNPQRGVIFVEFPVKGFFAHATVSHHLLDHLWAQEGPSYFAELPDDAPSMPDLEETGILSAAGSPLKDGDGKVKGLIYLDSLRDGTHFEEQQMTVLEKFSKTLSRELQPLFRNSRPEVEEEEEDEEVTTPSFSLPGVAKKQQEEEERRKGLFASLSELSTDSTIVVALDDAKSLGDAVKQMELESRKKDLTELNFPPLEPDWEIALDEDEDVLVEEPPVHDSVEPEPLSQAEEQEQPGLFSEPEPEPEQVSIESWGVESRADIDWLESGSNDWLSPDVELPRDDESGSEEGSLPTISRYQGGESFGESVDLDLDIFEPMPDMPDPSQETEPSGESDRPEEAVPAPEPGLEPELETIPASLDEDFFSGIGDSEVELEPEPAPQPQWDSGPKTEPEAEEREAREPEARPKESEPAPEPEPIPANRTETETETEPVQVPETQWEPKPEPHEEPGPHLRPVPPRTSQPELTPEPELEPVEEGASAAQLFPEPDPVDAKPPQEDILARLLSKTPEELLAEAEEMEEEVPETPPFLDTWEETGEPIAKSKPAPTRVAPAHELEEVVPIEPREVEEEKVSWFGRLKRALWPFGRREIKGPTIDGLIVVYGAVYLDGKPPDESPLEICLVFRERGMKVLLSVSVRGDSARYEYCGAYSRTAPEELTIVITKKGYFPVKLSRVRLKDQGDDVLEAEIQGVTLLRDQG